MKILKIFIVPVGFKTDFFDPESIDGDNAFGIKRL